VQLIGATTEDEFDKFIKSDKAFERRLQKVQVNEPDQITSILMLRGLRERFEKHHQLHIKDSAITTAVTLASEFIADRYLPDKALDLIDLAASSLRINKEATPITLIQLSLDISRIEVELSLLENGEADTAAKREQLLDDLTNMVSISKEREQRWLEAKELSRKIDKLTKLVGSYSKEANENKRIGYESKYEEICNVLIPKIQEDLALLQKQAVDFNTILPSNELCGQDILNTFNKYHSRGQYNAQSDK
jgi:ATP-dependent Clp protease ATP-binding subunit ClpB